MNASPSVALFAPAKLNLFLAVTGRRADGFHDLVSLVAPLGHGDELRATALGEGPDELVCAAPGVPADATNLVLRAAAAWRQAGGVAPAVRFELEKRVPAGAGMGGGSSDAVAALKALQTLGRQPLAADRLAAVAAALGSDCPLFLAGEPVVMRGRGERLASLPAAARERLRGQRVLVCKPSFGVDTPWAYGRLVAGAPGSYATAEAAEARLAAWIEGRTALADVLENSFEPVVFGKFAALPVLARRLQTVCGLRLHLTGSGSASFALLPDGFDPAPAVAVVREAWGEPAFVVVTHLG